MSDFSGSASVITAKVTPSPRLEKHSNLTQDTRISGKPSAESRADSESKAFTESIPTDSESKKLTESTTLKNPSRALPNTKK
ncbi:hypothetical protein [uncultured Helicobacter sp.]|uniref:hypothetical protein n=1 Tax=uncultured Helicobacter sp. TaxID=175537 RepID=UPI003751A7A0